MKKGKFSIGEKVFLIHLQQEGVIKRWSGSELLYVEVDGDEIPVFISDVSKEFPEQKEGNVTEEKKRSEQTDENKIETGTNSGIFISFCPQKQAGGEVASFDIFLINDTVEPVDFSYYFLLSDKTHFALKKLLAPFNYMLIHSIEYDLLNEMPSVQLDVWDVMKKNFAGKLDQKIKPQNFFNKLMISPLMNRESYCYKVNVQPLKSKEEAKSKDKVSFDPEILKLLMKESVSPKETDVISAVEEIDLHIEALTKDYDSMDNSEMLYLQLQRFQQALERAIANGAEKFYAIHGVGSGKLKNEIHLLLKEYREVKSFNNDFHPRYGYGATEVILH
ncbi:MAG: Smr/MutS family protein [Chitinophagales bacterium]